MTKSVLSELNKGESDSFSCKNYSPTAIEIPEFTGLRGGEPVPTFYFHITENEMEKQSGYSRQWLRILRDGEKRVKGGETVVYDPFLVKGWHWERFGRAVLYADVALQHLQHRKSTE
jgi:hypothetical protein